MPKGPTAAKRGNLPTKHAIRNVDKVIVVASGKGGVGKSTTAVNLALALAQKSLRIGILDADIFGPSIPKLLGLKSDGVDIDRENNLIPLTNHGIQAMSMGFITGADEDSPIAWRGLMVMKAMQQLLHEVKWDKLDALIVDMPPGTGDVPLTLGQQVNVAGSVIISTPQDIALIDARKGTRMFQKLNIPILGLIQNMSLYICPKCGTQSHVFGQHGVQNAAKELHVPFLGDVPLDPLICDLSDKGIPIVASDPSSSQAKAYKDIADRVWAAVSYQ